jgi:uncharacterized protein (UPF0333 family)
MFARLNKRAQSTLEYAILIGVIAAALIGMQAYVKRGYSGKLKDGADSMGDQFAPQHTTFNYTTETYTHSQEILEQGKTTTQILNQTSNKWGNISTESLNQEDWFKR